jgi:hypothetical protein
MGGQDSAGIFQKEHKELHMRILLVIIMALVLNGETKEAYLSLTAEIRAEVDKQMKSLSVQVSNTIDSLVSDVSSYAESNTGLSTSQVVSNLTEIRKDNGGLFGDATKGLTASITDKTFAVSEDIFFGRLQTELDFDQSTTRMMWQAMLVNTCPSCLPLHGQVRTLRGWKATGGVPNERNTLCTIHGKCHCILVPEDIMPTRKEIREPLKIQSARIRKAEKKRGKKYAKSTKAGLLGRVNDPTSPTADLRTVKKVT